MKPNYELKPAMAALGITHLRKNQIQPIRSLMNHHDTLLIASTGFGKSICFQAPALLLGGLTLVIEPTLSLIYNQVQVLNERGIAADYLDHLRTRKEVDSILKKAQRGKLHFLYVTPERLQSTSFQDAMRTANVQMIVVDECHCVTEWGYTFRNAYLQIGDFIDALPNRPVICACSATILENMQDAIIQLLHMHSPTVIHGNLERKNLTIMKKDVTSKKSLEKRLEARIRMMDKYIRKHRSTGAVVIYALTTGYVDAIYNHLNDLYPGQVSRYHAKIKPDKLRHQMEMDFLKSKTKIMVATTAFGMGIDVPDVELVIHFNTPISMTDYIQQIGRAGRNEQIKAHCVLFYDLNNDDKRIAESFQKKADKQAAKQLKNNYRQIFAFISSNGCMVQDILNYQGQSKSKSCKCCTNCAKKRRGDHT